jgi:hypothetical protein
MLSVIVQRIIYAEYRTFYFYGKCRYTEFRYAERRGATFLAKAQTITNDQTYSSLFASR